MVYRDYQKYSLPKWIKETNTVQDPHVVILGAGASRQAFPKGDANGRLLPLMKDFVDIVGLNEILNKNGINADGLDFEALYDDLASSQPNSSLINEIEKLVYEYFSRMELPATPTIYDYLVTSLRNKDVIATFNWDPLLFQAYKRNLVKIGQDQLPSLIYLHGNTALGVCHKDRLVQEVDTLCPKCEEPLVNSKLLYPVKHKNYTDDHFIKSQWDGLRLFLSKACIVTVFGYSAPVSDIEAKTLMLEVWEKNSYFEIADFEIIDIQPEEVLEKNWEHFTFSHHWKAYKSIQESFLFSFPRRSCEAYFDQNFNVQFLDYLEYPCFESMNKLADWLSAYLTEEYDCISNKKPLTLHPNPENKYKTYQEDEDISEFFSVQQQD